MDMKPALDGFCERHPGSRWIPAAAGGDRGERTLIVWDSSAGASFLAKPGPPSGRTAQRVVPVVTIDSLLDERAIDMPDLVKLDVQGFELEVLRGGRRLFGAVEAFVLETSFYRFHTGMPLFHEVVAFMAERDYYAYGFGGWLRRPSDRALAQADVCFARKTGILRASDLWS
jgi:FkbM family methyltransferase